MIAPAALQKILLAEGHWLSLVSVSPGKPLVYYAGAGWSQAGFPIAKDWFRYLEQSAQRQAVLLEVVLSSKKGTI